jgi:hypothetical protein
MSCGFPGDEPEDTYNTHYIGVSRLDKWNKNKFFRHVISRLGLSTAFLRYRYRNFHFTGGALGCFMKNVRRPDLNIITAEIVGWGSRTDVTKSFHAKTVLAATDPVALDYIAARDVLLPATPKGLHQYEGLMYTQLNDPDDKKGPFYRFLLEAAQEGAGELSEEYIRVVSHRFANNSPEKIFL